MISRLAAAGKERSEVDVHVLLKDEELRRLVLDALLDDPPPRQKGESSRRRAQKRLLRTVKKARIFLKSKASPQASPKAFAQSTMSSTTFALQASPKMSAAPHTLSSTISTIQGSTDTQYACFAQQEAKAMKVPASSPTELTREPSTLSVASSQPEEDQASTPRATPMPPSNLAAEAGTSG